MKKRLSFSRVILLILAGFLASIALSLVYYVVFSIFFSTDIERKLADENAVLSRELPALERSAAILRDEMGYLESSDARIYGKVFEAEAPGFGHLMGDDLLYGDLHSGGDLVSRSYSQSSRSLGRASAVEDDWREIFSALNSKGYVLPPLSSPVGNISSTNIGASVGEKMNPFYKLKVYHNGLDIIAQPGTPVLAAGRGVVTTVKKSEGGKGNSVEITHPGGYVTCYGHLAGISVKKGQKVGTGAVIGVVGNSGRSFVTHLHYEMSRDGVVLDPVNYLFASTVPEDYVEMLIMSASSAQSMD